MNQTARESTTHFDHALYQCNTLIRELTTERDAARAENERLLELLEALGVDLESGADAEPRASRR